MAISKKMVLPGKAGENSLDMAIARHVIEVEAAKDGRRRLERVGAMLTVMAKKLQES